MKPNKKNILLTEDIAIINHTIASQKIGSGQASALIEAAGALSMQGRSVDGLIQELMDRAAQLPSERFTHLVQYRANLDEARRAEIEMAAQQKLYTRKEVMQLLAGIIEAAKAYLDHYDVLESDELDALKDDLKGVAEACVEVHREAFPTEDKA